MNVGTKLTAAGELGHLKSMADVVADYRKRFDYHTSVERSEGRHDPVVDWCIEAGSFEDAIRRAVAGKRRDGKMFSEDCSIPAEAKRQLTATLLKSKGKIGVMDSFEELHDFIRSKATNGVGRLTVYNIAARIGATINLDPNRYVYLHAGPLRGWKALTRSRSSPSRVLKTTLPRELQELPTHQIEDFFCEYSDFLHPGLISHE